ncbi:uncharacterized protein EAF01_006833 [Botrytis porri]|uniref:Phospholipase/carboxylesterase/thioesterase domain-containing protein n=1 Tax=Botrytis porri TaxID=87229 RepID=A0A4Z1KZS1_9HELO|nr:uncharacterized protein EAF01_006833 [Botrytis porri]KAF7903784.1 hypothetical protein EAF01_006833 [Botrytis porri]TGO89976.1 hypothetical protein BPOR_0084g00040 [Botrytis porri]
MNAAAEQSNEQPSEERKDSKVDENDIKTEESTRLGAQVYPDGSVIIPRKIGTYHTRSVILVHDVFDTAVGWAKEFMEARLNGETIMSIFPGTNWCFPEVDYPWLVQDIESDTSDPTDEMVDLWTAYSETVQSEERLDILEALGQMMEPIQQLVDRESNLVGIQNVFIGGLSDGATAALHLFLASQGNHGGGMGGFIGMNGVLPFHAQVKLRMDTTPNLEDLSLEEYTDKQMQIFNDVVSFMRNTLDLPPGRRFDRTFAHLGNPIFLGSIMTDPADLELRQIREDMIETLRRFRCFHPIYFTNDCKEPDLDGQVEGLVEYLRTTGSIRVPG